MTEFYPGLSLDIAEDDWEITGDDEDPGSRLTLNPTLRIAGVPMHLEAYAVHEEPEGVASGGFVSTMQVADHAWGETAVNCIYEIGGHDKPLDTVTIRGREYVLVAYPHC